LIKAIACGVNDWEILLSLRCGWRISTASCSLARYTLLAIIDRSFPAGM